MDVYLNVQSHVVFLSYFNFFLIMDAIQQTCFCLSEAKDIVSTYGAYFVLLQFILGNQVS